MLSEQQTRTVMTNGTSAGPSASERPGIQYCHNVMPSKEGLDAVGYETIAPYIVFTGGNNPLTDTRTIFGDKQNRIELAWDTNGRLYALLLGASNWITLPATSPSTMVAGFSANKVTVGTVNGVSYIFYSKKACFRYNETTNSLDFVPLAGLSIGTIKGVAGSNGYLVAYSRTAIAWSSVLTPTDFVPDGVNGAGGANVDGIEGRIKFAVTNSLGLLLYTDSNVVAGTYTGDSTFPFKFRPVDGSKGGVNLEQTGYEARATSQFVYSKAGLQRITSQKSENILPEVTDFLSGRRFEDFDTDTNDFVQTNLGSSTQLKKKIKFVSSRYLVLSYGITSLTHALVYDLSLNRLGKLRIDHVDVFEYVSSQQEAAKESIAFLAENGTTKTLDFTVQNNTNSVLIMGQLQHSRGKLMTLLGVDVENVPDKAALEVSTRYSLSGKEADATVPGLEYYKDDQQRKYSFLQVGVTHALYLKGRFNLVTLQITYMLNGRR